VLDPFRPGKDPFAELAIVLSGAFARHDETRERRVIADRLRAAATAEPARGEELKELLTDLAGEGKDRAVALARQRLPGLDLTPGRRRVPHTGLADAGCLALYGRRGLP
jgi:hypothetical protein